MHRGLPLVESIKLVSFSSFESKFGTLVNSTTLFWASCNSLLDFRFTFKSSLSSIMLTWTLEVSLSGSQMNLYVPSTSDIISICNAVLEISEVLKYSFPSLNSCFQNSSTMKATISFYTYWVVIYGVKAITIQFIRGTWQFLILAKSCNTNIKASQHGSSILYQNK